MSGKSAKKKRLGSRRTVSRQKETPAADDFPIAESISEAQQHVAEESSPSVNVMLDPTEFRLETAHPVPVNRRKLGSSRRLKGRQHGEDSEIDTGPDVRAEVEENTRGQSTFETTQMSEALQRESLIEISHLSKHAISAPSKTASTSTLSPEYCSEVMKISPTICSEEALGSPPTKNENKMQLFENEESKENPHENTTSQLIPSSVPSCLLENKQLVNVSSSNSMAMVDKGLSNVYSVEEIEIKKSDYTEINTWTGHLQGSSLTSDSFEELVVLESKTPEIITDKSNAREITDMKHSLEQQVVANMKQNEHFNVPEGRYAQHSEEVWSKLNDEMQHVHREDNFPQSNILHLAEEEIPNRPNTQSKDEVSQHTDVKETPESKTTSTTAEEKKEELSKGGKHNMYVSSDSSTCIDWEAGFQLDERERLVPGARKGPNEFDPLGSEDVTGYHCSVDNAESKLKDEVQITQKEEMMALLNTENVPNAAQHNNTSDMILKQPIDLNTDNPDLIEKNAVDSATNDGTSNSNWKPDERLVELGHMDENKGLGNSSCMDEQTETHSGSSENGCMLESSCTQEGRQQLKESEIELSDNVESGLTSETMTMPLTTETKKEQSIFGEFHQTLSVSHDNPVSSVSAIDYPSEVENYLLKNIYSEMESAIPKCTSIVEDQDMRERGIKMEVLDKFGEAELNSLDSSVTLEIKKDKEAHLSKDDEKSVSQHKFIPTQNPTMSHHTSYHITHEAVDLDNSEIIHGNATDHSEIPKPHLYEVSVKNMSDPAAWQKNVSPGIDPVRENPTKETHLTLESESECDFVADSKELWVNHSEIEGPHHIEDDVNKQKQSKKLKLIHNTFEVTLDDTDGSCEIISGNLKDAEIKSTDQQDMMAKTSNDSANKQKHSVPDDPQIERDTIECNLEPLEWKNESDHLWHPKKTQISEVDRQLMSSHYVDVLKDNTKDVFHREKVELFFEAAENKPSLEIVDSKNPFASQPLVNLSTESLQTKSLITLVETITEGIDKSDSLQVEKEHDGELVNTSELTVSDVFANHSGVQWIIDQAQCSQMSHGHSSIGPEEDEGTDNHIQALTFEGKVENYSVNEPYVRALTVIATEKKGDEEQTEECVDGTVDLSKPVQKQEMAQVFCQSPSDKNNRGDIFPPEPDIKSTEDCLDIVKFSDLGNQHVFSEQKSLQVTNQDSHGTKKKVIDIEKIHKVQSDMETCTEKTDQDNNGHFGPLQQNNTDPSPNINQEILGSSQDEFTVTFLEEIDKSGKAKTEDVNVDAKQMTHFGRESLLSECSNLTSGQQLIKSVLNKMPDEGLPTSHSVSEDKETDKGAETLKLADRFLGDYSLMDVDSEYKTFSMAAEMCSDKSNSRTHENQQEVFSSPKKETTKIREPKEDLNSSQSGDVVNRLQKDRNQATGMHQSSYSSDPEDESLLQTLNTNICSDAQLLDTCQSINDEIYTDIKPARSKRRLGSSRRFKGSQQVKEGTSETHHETREHIVETIKTDECLQITKISLKTQMEEESDNLTLAEGSRKNGSTRSDNTVKLSGDDVFFSQNVMKSRASETVDPISNFDNFAFLKSSADIEDNLEYVRGLTESDTGVVTLTQTVQRVESDMPNISSHDDNAGFTSAAEDVVDQTEVSQTQNTDALTCDSDSFGQKVHYMKETQNCGKTADSSMDVQGLQEDEVGRKCEDPADEDNAAQGIYISPQLVSAAQTPEGDVPSNTGFSPAMDASNNSESERSHSGHCEIYQVKSTQKKRKMGSTRRSLLHRGQDEEKVQEETTDTDSDMRNVECEVVEQLQTCAEVSQNENVSLASSETYKELQDTAQSLSTHGGEHEQRGSHPNIQSIDSHVIPDINDLLDHSPQQSVANNVSIVSAFKDANLTDIGTGFNIAAHLPRTENLTSTENQISSEKNGRKITNAEMAMGGLLPHLETTQMTQSEEKPESVELTEGHEDDQQNQNDALESRHFSVMATTNTRRKMGSARRDMGFHHKGVKLHQHQEEENQAREPETPDRDETAVTCPRFEEQELQLHSENSTDKEENVLETVERTHINETHLRPLAQKTAPQSKPVETEHQLFVSGLYPSTSATMPELASGGRRRKMGSHRKSPGAHYQKDQRVVDEEAERKVNSITEACENTSTEEQREKPSSPDKISEVDGSPTKPSPSFSDRKVQDSIRPVSEDAQSQSQHANATLNQESQMQPSLVGAPRGEALGSSGYNVVMIGDSGVGKTSFMKRALSGKFILTLPASIGIDTVMWTVVVDGKPVVLHVWDTAGQERFRSITRQVFHRAQAFLLMYDISSSQSFSAVSYWASCIQESGAENAIVFLIGNKSDCAERKVETHQGQILAQECNFGFMECSAATGENVIESLESVARMLSQTYDSRREAMVLHKEPEKKKGSRCC